MQISQPETSCMCAACFKRMARFVARTFLLLPCIPTAVPWLHYQPRHSWFLAQHWCCLEFVGGASNTGGAVLKSYFSAQQLNDLMPRLNPDRPTGLNYYPLLHPGERCPASNPYPPTHPPTCFKCAIEHLSFIFKFDSALH